MIDDMPKPHLLHLHKQITRHGKTVWYFRVDKGPRTRINGEYGSLEFMAEYRAALSGEPIPVAPLQDKTTLKWLVDQYMSSAAWTNLKPATQRQRENIFKNVLSTGANTPFVKITKKSINAGIDRRKETPFAARNFLYTMRGLFQWAVKAEHTKVDPTHGVVAETPETDGFPPWTEEEVTQFEAFYPEGTRERLALAIYLYTGMRRGDAARFGRQHVKNGVILFHTEKTNTIVEIPILPELQHAIDTSPTGDMVYFCGERGRPMTKESFGNWFREICDKAGISKSAHGLRKTGATRAAEGGATEAQLNAIFGWTDAKMAQHYVRAANRAKLAKAAMGMMSGPKI